MRASLLPVMLMSACLFGSSVASATDKPSDKQRAASPSLRDAADEWFEKGVSAYGARKLKDAEAAFLEAWKVKQTQDIAANLGAVEMELGHHRAAAEHLRFAVEHAAPTDSDDARRATKLRYEAARKLVGAVRVRVNVEGARVSINGEVMSAAQLANERFVEPGTVTVEAKLDGYKDARVTLDVGRGSSKEAAIVLERERRNPIPAIVMGSAGAVALGLGLSFIGIAESKRGQAKSLADQTNHACPVSDPAPTGKCAELASVASSADTFGNAGIGLLVVAGVAAAGVTTYMLWPQSKPQSALRLTPTMGPRVGGLVFSGSF